MTINGLILLFKKNIYSMSAFDRDEVELEAAALPRDTADVTPPPPPYRVAKIEQRGKDRDRQRQGQRGGWTERERE